jgi:hypothetical protein
MGKQILVAIILSLITCPSWAASWVQVATDSSGSIFYIDKTSIQKNGGLVTYWMKVLQKNTHKIPSENTYIRGSKVWYLLKRTSQQCSNNVVAYPVEQTIYYGLQGQVLSSNESFYSPSEPAPGTVGEIIHNVLCNPDQ